MPPFEAHQLCVKVFATANPDVTANDYIRAFHAWIQTRALGDELAIDVTDYSHVPHGPGVLLIADGAQYGVNNADGRLGLQYVVQRDDPGPLDAKLRASLCRLFARAQRLERDLLGRIQFQTDSLQIRINSRLLAPNTTATFAAARTDIDAVTSSLYGTPAALKQYPDDKRAFTVFAQGTVATPINDLITRLTASRSLL